MSVKELKVYVNVKKVGRRVILAICDVEVLGRTLKEGDVAFKVSEHFYKGAEVELEDAISMMEGSTVINMVGENIVKKAVEMGYVHPEAVINIGGVPHAQIVRFM